MQFFLYLIVGGLSFLVEIGTFVALRHAAMAVIPASVTSFIVATVANYLLSILLAFERGRFRRHVELARFFIVVLVGLALNTALVWLFAYPLAIHPTVAKIAAVPIVLIWNYLGRRLLVFDDRIPVSMGVAAPERRAFDQSCRIFGTILGPLVLRLVLRQNSARRRWLETRASWTEALLNPSAGVDPPQRVFLFRHPRMKTWTPGSFARLSG